MVLRPVQRHRDALAVALCALQADHQLNKGMGELIPVGTNHGAVLIQAIVDFDSLKFYLVQGFFNGLPDQGEDGMEAQRRCGKLRKFDQLVDQGIDLFNFLLLL